MKKLVAILLAVLLCLPLGIWGEENSPVKSPLVIAGYPAPDVPWGESVDASYFEDAIFIGDSLAEGLSLSGLMPGLEFITKIGQSANGVVKNRVYKYDGKTVRMIDILKDKQPGKLYIWLGSNGVDKYTPEYVLPSYEAMLDLFISELPDTIIYCVALAPVIQRRAQRQYPKMTNARIHAFNDLIAAAAKERNVYYLPVSIALMNEDGGLDKDLSAGDGIHLSKEGYQKISDFLHKFTIPYE